MFKFFDELQIIFITVQCFDGVDWASGKFGFCSTQNICLNIGRLNTQ